MSGYERRTNSVMLCGTPVQDEKVRLLASMLGGDTLAQKLERAVENRNAIVALSVEDRQRIVDVLDGPPWSLPELRSALAGQLKKQKDKALQQQRSSLNQEMVRHRRERLQAAGPDASTNER